MDRSFAERVLHRRRARDRVGRDALAVPHERGLVDLDRIAELLRRAETRSPTRRAHLPRSSRRLIGLGDADAYLSGAVRDQAPAAQAAAALDPVSSAMSRRSKRSLPADLALRHHRPPRRAVDTGPRLVAFSGRGPWRETPIYHTVEIASWSIQRPAPSLAWQPPRPTGAPLAAMPANSDGRPQPASLPQIYDELEEDGSKKNGSSTPPTPKPPRTSS